MKTISLVIIFLFSAPSIYSQTQKSATLNLDFENAQNGTAVGWSNFGSSTYIIGLDSTTVRTGAYSASIEFASSLPNFKAWGYTLPNNYEGKKITLTGYIKTENVIDGYAGLWMRIDPSIAFNNMMDKGIKGTTDWTKYEITLPMDPDRTKQIVIGGLLVGKGKMWIDDLMVTIDGKEIKNLKPYERKIFPAERDTEFDKSSRISTATLSDYQIENLKKLGLVWGFIKYYHPNIAKGDYNWDYELFRIFPKVLATENTETLNEVLITWVNGFGKFSEGKEVVFKNTDIKFGPDLNWINNSGFSEKLIAELQKIKQAKRTNEHYYIGMQAGAGNPDFKNENSYSSMKYPDAGFRLLSLFRYWNIIQYYFPYKNLIEEDWKKVLEEFIPKVFTARNETEYLLAMLELIGRIHDTHANIWSRHQSLEEYFGMRYAAVELRFAENKAIVTGYHHKEFGKETGLLPGDVITKVNNKSVDALVNDQLKFAPASNMPTHLRDIANKMLRTNDTTLVIEFSRDEKIETRTLKTFSLSEIKLTSRFSSSDTSFKLINKDIGYINHGSLKRVHLPKIWNEIQHTKGLIIDIRNYPSDFPGYDLSRYLLPERAPFAKFTNGSIKNPGLFTFTKPYKTGGKNKDYYKGKIILILNEVSQSSAEFHAMGYRVCPRVTVIGSTTAGADGNVSQISLPGAISTMISGIGVYYPDGKETQRIGIVPDIEIKPTIKGIRDGKDELLEKAIAIINE